MPVDSLYQDKKREIHCFKYKRSSGSLLLQDGMLFHR